jgi:hypothetical protein
MWLLFVVACTPDPPPAPPPPAPVVEAAPPPVAPPVEGRYAASHVLVAFAGAVGAPASVTRTREQALALAESVRARALAGEDFAALAREASDGPSGPRGGGLGVYPAGTMVPDFERAVASVDVGQVGPIVETPFGVHVVRRDAIEEIDVAHLVVGFAGATRSDATRTRDEARARVAEARAAIDAGAPWEDVVRRYSEDATVRRGGSLGVVARGQLVPEFEDVAFSLQPGQVSDVVETPYGWHLIRRSSAANVTEGDSGRVAPTPDPR